MKYLRADIPEKSSNGLQRSSMPNSQKAGRKLLSGCRSGSKYNIRICDIDQYVKVGKSEVAKNSKALLMEYFKREGKIENINLADNLENLINTQ